MRRTLLWIGLTLALVACNRAPPAPIMPGPASTPAAAWSDIEAAARGQEVFFNAWAGDERVNAFIAWASAELAQHYGVKLTHVKTQDTAEAIARILAEKAAGRVDDGSVDLLWINGENFAALKANAMLFGPFVERLPIAPMIDFAGQPSFSSDFTIPVEGLEAPWGCRCLCSPMMRRALPTRRGIFRPCSPGPSQSGPLHLSSPAEFHRLFVLKTSDAGDRPSRT
jgi:ABC-type uncharacterized transport system, periplasmic component